MTVAEERREKLSPRREGARITLTCTIGENEKAFDAQFNFYPDGRLSEAFCRPFRTGTELEEQLDRFCQVLSVSLQLGARIGEIAHMTGDDLPLPVRPDSKNVVPGNIFGMIIRGGVAAEAERIAITAPKTQGATP